MFLPVVQPPPRAPTGLPSLGAAALALALALPSLASTRHGSLLSRGPLRPGRADSPDIRSAVAGGAYAAMRVRPYAQDHACFTAGLESGFRIYNTDPVKERLREGIGRS